MSNRMKMKKPSEESIHNMEDLHRKVVELITNQEFSRLTFIQQMLDRKGQNLKKECGYPTEEPDYKYYNEMYREEGVATRVNDLFPEETWSVTPEMTENPDPNKTTRFERAWGKLVDNPDTNPWHYLHRVDVLSGIGRYGALFLGFNDGEDESKPVPGIDPLTGESDGTNPGLKLNYMRAFAEGQLVIESRIKNLKSPRQGYPEFYTLTPDEGTTDDDESGTSVDDRPRIHWTRVVPIADNRKSSEVYGTPRMRPVLHRLLDLRKILGASAEMFYKGGWPGHSIEAMPGVTDDLDPDLESIKDQMEPYYNKLQRYIALVGATVKPLLPNIADPGPHVAQQLQAIAAALGCPLRVFVGSEAAHLASTQDIQTWNKRIAKRQRQYVNPLMVDPLVRRLTAAGVLPPVDKYTVNWRDLNALSDKDKADVSLKKAQALLQYVSSGSEKAVGLMHFLTVFMDIPDALAKTIVEAATANKKFLTKELWKPAGAQPAGSGKKQASKKTASGSTRNATGKAKK